MGNITVTLCIAPHEFKTFLTLEKIDGNIDTFRSVFTLIVLFVFWFVLFTLGIPSHWPCL